jgi:putative heme iron utilization protein
MNEDDDKYKNVLDNAVIGTSTEDDNKFKKVLDNATESCDTSLMATTNDIVTNIGNKLPTMTRHGKINEIDDGIYGEI